MEKKPRVIRGALLILWTSLFASIGAWILAIADNPGAFSGDWVVWSAKILVGYLLNIVLLLALARGCGWIRWLIVAVVFHYILKNYSHLLEEAFRLSAVLAIAIMAARIIALILLFCPSSNEWFSGRKKT